MPTKFTSTRKLSAEIRSWYLAYVPGCTGGAIRESVHGEEAIASHLSLPEYCPTSIVADEMREVIQEVWARLNDAAKQQSMKEPSSRTTPKKKRAAEYSSVER